ncbi:MAG: ferrous iron transporter B, partial [Lentisphaerae bacterium]
MSVCHEKKKKGMLEAMSCCENGSEAPEKLEGLKRVLLVGMPNVGKSQLFNQLTGRYVTVSNYPGTTVEVTEARGEIPGLGLVRVTDTPGMYSLWGVTEEEKVAARMVLGCENVQAVVHVVDAKNIGRMLGLTLQLIEAGLPVVLVLNMMDEALAAGVTIDSAALEARLGIRVIETVATRGKGIDMLRNAILNAKVSDKHFLNIPDLLQRKVLDDSEKGAGEALDHARIFRRISLLFGQHEEEWEKEMGNSDLVKVNRQLRYELGHAPHFVLQESVQQVVNGLLSGVVKEVGKKQVDWRWRLAQFLDRLCLHPLSGAVIFLVVVYFGLYRFVGDFAAGTVVDFLESKVFEGWLMPPVDRFIKGLLPWEWLWSLFVGDYGVISLGVRYAIALIMPIVGAFFLAFSLLEDSGYL